MNKEQLIREWHDTDWQKEAFDKNLVPIHVMFERIVAQSDQERDRAVREVLDEVEKLKSDYVLAPGRNHYISLHEFKSKIQQLREGLK